ncbi:MAG TPA: hypothetical protein VEA18_03940 [Candidatus Kapabacteria bacterium]|nr:hypothetical protein [Candidatus Kapabacteria bacterium]
MESTGTPTDHPVTQAEIDRLREAVLVTRPTLREIIEKRGHKTLYEYAREYSDVNLNPAITERQGECISTIRRHVTEQLGPIVGDGVAKQLEKYYFVSTADHHGPICHSFFLNSNLVTSITCLEQQDPVLKYVIAFSCANVSFSNHTYPRGLLFNTYVNGKIQTQQLGFFPNSSSVRQARVFNYRAYTRDDVDKVKRRLQELVAEGSVTEAIADRVETLLQNIYLREDILACTTYSEQITKSNYHLWNAMFDAIEKKGPHLLYIELEAIVMQLLLDHHMKKSTTLHRILFDSAYGNAFVRIFNNIEGGFSVENGWGTYLFWGLPKDAKYPKKMRKVGQTLVSDDGSYTVPLTPEGIGQALRQKEVFPSTQLSLLVLSLYYGMKCLGGFCQVNYLTYMKEVYKNMLQELGDTESALACERVQTKELGEDLTIAFLGGPHGSRALATSLDVILYGTPETWQTLVDETREIRLAEALNPMMPDFYPVMYKEVDRDPVLSKIKAEDIMKATGLDQKVRICATIPET